MRFRAKLVLESLVQVGIDSPTTPDFVACDNHGNYSLDIFQVFRCLIAFGADTLYRIEQLIDAFFLDELVFEISPDALVVSGNSVSRRQRGELRFDQDHRISADDDLVANFVLTSDVLWI